jgi:hypothetical protein
VFDLGYIEVKKFSRAKILSVQKEEIWNYCKKNGATKVILKRIIDLA